MVEISRFISVIGISFTQCQVGSDQAHFQWQRDLVLEHARGSRWWSLKSLRWEPFIKRPTGKLILLLGIASLSLGESTGKLLPCWWSCFEELLFKDRKSFVEGESASWEKWGEAIKSVECPTWLYYHFSVIGGFTRSQMGGNWAFLRREISFILEIGGCTNRNWKKNNGERQKGERSPKDRSLLTN